MGSNKRVFPKLLVGVVITFGIIVVAVFGLSFGGSSRSRVMVIENLFRGASPIEESKVLSWGSGSGTRTSSLLEDFGLRDMLSRLEVSQESDHTIEFGTIAGMSSSSDTITLIFDPSTSAWDLGDIYVSDLDLEVEGVDESLCTGTTGCTPTASAWGVSINDVDDEITFTSPTLGAGIAADSSISVEIGTNATYQATGSNQIINPSSVGEYEVYIRVDNLSDVEVGEVEIPIVDDDTVNVSGYIETVLTFDVDTAVDNIDCDAEGEPNPCDSHGGVDDNVGYMVDLGYLTADGIRRSGDTDVLHEDGTSGTVNYIWMDLTSNYNGGTGVMVQSQYGGLMGPDASLIPSVSDGGEQEISTSTFRGYGINLRSGSVVSAVMGDIVINDECDSDGGDDWYCSLPSAVSREIFNTNEDPIHQARLQWSLAALPRLDNNTGIYNDRLTFVAVGTF